MSRAMSPPKSMYYGVFGALMVGTALTVGAAFSTWAAQQRRDAGIAITKALLVILFFMHVRWSTRLTWVVAASGFFWLLILFGLTMSDYLTRGWVTGHLALRRVHAPTSDLRSSALAVCRPRLRRSPVRRTPPVLRVRIVYTESCGRPRFELRITAQT